jgi:geranylgeranyl diphosphate synthase type II
MTNTTFQGHLDDLRSIVEPALRSALSRADWPSSLSAAVEYSLMAGGKRLRPVLVLLANEVCGGSVEAAVPAAVAIEMIHTYSLIHDDLPSMDDDDFRRGRPTSHKVFGEALAVLAGDCLLTSAFEIVTSAPLPTGQIAELVRILASASGGGGMVGGQVLDLEAERGSFLTAENSASLSEMTSNTGCRAGEIADSRTAEFTDSSEQSEAFHSSNGDLRANDSNQTAETRVVELTRIHKMKTGALIAGALELGAVCASADSVSRNQLRRYGHCIGLAFQIADDLLDVTGEQTKLGKKPGRDVDLGKLTYPGLLGINESRQKAEQLVQEACRAVEVFGNRSVWLKDLARFIVERDH